MLQYLVFGIVILVMLSLDLGVFNKKSHEVTTKEAVIWSLVWVSLSMLFSGYIYWDSGVERFSQFQSAYWVEKLLSVDNLFVFILVFGYFNVPKYVQHKVLFWGILGALVFRAIFIFSGVKLIELTYLPEFNIGEHVIHINVILTIFGAFLVYAGIKSWISDDDDDEEKDFSKSPGAKFVTWLFPRVTKEFHGDKFFVKKEIRVSDDAYSEGEPYNLKKGEKWTPDVESIGGVKYYITKMATFATPLLVVIGVIEFTDLVFAVDSIPAIFAIAPKDPFILYSSNIFAILGLRSLYFLLSNFIGMFKYLKYGIAIILSFIGTKMLISPIYHIESGVSLVILLSILVITIIASLLSKKSE